MIYLRISSNCHRSTQTVQTELVRGESIIFFHFLTIRGIFNFIFLMKKKCWRWIFFLIKFLRTEFVPAGACFQFRFPAGGRSRRRYAYVNGRPTHRPTRTSVYLTKEASDVVEKKEHFHKLRLSRWGQNRQ